MHFNVAFVDCRSKVFTQKEYSLIFSRLLRLCTMGWSCSWLEKRKRKGRRRRKRRREEEGREERGCLLWRELSRPQSWEDYSYLSWLLSETGECVL